MKQRQISTTRKIFSIILFIISAVILAASLLFHTEIASLFSPDPGEYYLSKFFAQKELIEWSKNEGLRLGGKERGCLIIFNTRMSMGCSMTDLIHYLDDNIAADIPVIHVLHPDHSEIDVSNNKMIYEIGNSKIIVCPETFRSGWDDLLKSKYDAGAFTGLMLALDNSGNEVARDHLLFSEEIKQLGYYEYFRYLANRISNEVK